MYITLGKWFVLKANFKVEISKYVARIDTSIIAKVTSETCIYGILHNKFSITTYSLNQDLPAIICYMITFLEHIIILVGFIWEIIFCFTILAKLFSWNLDAFYSYVFNSIWNAVSFEIWLCWNAKIFVADVFARS